MKKEFDNGAESTELDTEAGYNESRVYELGFHLDPELPQEEAKKTYQVLRDIVSGAGTIVAEGQPQKVQLAYTISRSVDHIRRDYDSAYFCWIAYEADGEGHEVVLGAAKSEMNIIRFLDIRTEKELAIHAAEMHEIYAKAAVENSVAPEEVLDTDLDQALKEVEA
jgi:ribosomal protein S6